MSTPYRAAEIRAARKTPLKPLLEARGYRLKPRSAGNYDLLGVAGEIVLKEHYWVRLEDGAAGNAIDFFVRIEGRSFNEAMQLLAAGVS